LLSFEPEQRDLDGLDSEALAAEVQRRLDDTPGMEDVSVSAARPGA
jgi:hypothetical protein